MKLEVEIECTPEEARAFFGLPDVQPLQEALMAELQKRMMANLQVMEPEQLFKSWLPAGLQGWEQLQKAFWTQMAAQKTPGPGNRGPGNKKPGNKDEEKP